MKTIKGPALFIAQFADDKPPFNSLKSISEWAKSIGYKAIQIPSWDSRFMDLKKAAESQAYADKRDCRSGWRYPSYLHTYKDNW